jgi:Ca-activated chloride channel family protein
MRHTVRRAALLGAALSTALVTALTGASTATAEAAGAANKQPPRIETILDVSGSMKEKDVGGGTRMDAAKESMNTMIDAAPGQLATGVRVYGSEYPGQDTAVGCKDTKLLHPVEPMDATAKAEVKKQIDALKPTGFTPIGYSLRKAAEDLGAAGSRRIILLSDGEETCGPPADPCEVAEKLDGAGKDLAVDTLGFRVKGKAAEQLKCIAKATGGQYREAQDKKELNTELKAAFVKAAAEMAKSGLPDGVIGGSGKDKDKDAGKDAAKQPGKDGKDGADGGTDSTDGKKQSATKTDTESAGSSFLLPSGITIGVVLVGVYFLLRLRNRRSSGTGTGPGGGPTAS